MAAVPSGALKRNLRKRIAANQAQLLVFITNRDVSSRSGGKITEIETKLLPSCVVR
jgi:hypothetical protein